MAFRGHNPIDAEEEMTKATTREKRKKQTKNPEQQAPCGECHARLQQPLLQLQLLGVLEEVPVVGHQAEEAAGDEVLGVGARGCVQDDAQLPQGLHPAQRAELAVHRDGRGGNPRDTEPRNCTRTLFASFKHGGLKTVALFE